MCCAWGEQGKGGWGRLLCWRAIQWCWGWHAAAYGCSGITLSENVSSVWCTCPRYYESAPGTCHLQGTASRASGNGGCSPFSDDGGSSASYACQVLQCVSSLDGMGEDAPLAKLAGITSRSSLLPVGDISYSAVTGSNLVCPPWSWLGTSEGRATLPGESAYPPPNSGRTDPAA